jgi:hypothetical protein
MINHVKFLISFIWIIALPFQLTAQEKTVFVTLDVSTSMKGDKYNLANYTIQLLTSLLDNDDELYVILYGCVYEIDLKNKQKELNKLKTIRFLAEKKQVIKDLNCVYVEKTRQYTESGDLLAFSKFFRDPARDNWLFIVGDGDRWDTSTIFTGDFNQIIQLNPIKCFFLQTGKTMEEKSDFSIFLDSHFPDIKQHQASTKPATITEGCLTIASEILGIDYKGVSASYTSSSTFIFQSDMPVNKIIILYQDEKSSSRIAKLKNISQGKEVYKATGEYDLTNELLLMNPNEQVMSGRTWVVETKGKPFEPNRNIALAFDRPLSGSLKIFPVVEVVPKLLDPGMKSDGFTFRGNAMYICKENDSVTVRYSINYPDGTQVTSEALRKVTAVVSANGTEYKGVYHNGAFEFVMPLQQDTTTYTARFKKPGYFNLIKPNQQIIKSEVCQPAALGEIFLGEFSGNDLMDGKCIEGYLIDKTTRDTILYDPLVYELHIENNYPKLFKDITVSFHGNKLVICTEKRGNWCDCFLPDSLKFIISVQARNPSTYKSFQQEVVIAMADEQPWLLRCREFLILAAALILAFFYVARIRKKNRFARGAEIITENRNPILTRVLKNQYPLRRKGGAAWASRWLRPNRSESNSIYFNEPRQKFMFISGSAKYQIYIPRSDFDAHRMRYSGFDPDDKNENFALGSNEKVIVKKIQAADPRAEFHFEYNPPESGSGDIKSFRLFCGFLQFLITLGVFWIGYLLFISGW